MHSFTNNNSFYFQILNGPNYWLFMYGLYSAGIFYMGHSLYTIFTWYRYVWDGSYY